MKTVLLLGGPAAGQVHEVHGAMRTILSGGTVGQVYHVVPMCSHGEVHWFGVQDGADPLALLIAGYAQAARRVGMHPALGMGYGENVTIGTTLHYDPSDLEDLGKEAGFKP